MIGNCLAEADDETRDLVTAREKHLESARLFTEIGDRHYGLIAHHNQAWITEDLGDPAEARRLHEESLLIAREIGNESIEADALAQLGMTARDEGRLDDAVALLQAATRINVRRGMRASVATQLSRLSSALVRRGDAELAARLLGASNAQREQLGAKIEWWAAERNEETLGLIRSALGDDAAVSALEAGRALAPDQAAALALDDTL